MDSFTVNDLLSHLENIRAAAGGETPVLLAAVVTSKGGGMNLEVHPTISIHQFDGGKDGPMVLLTDDVNVTQMFTPSNQEKQPAIFVPGMKQA